MSFNKIAFDDGSLSQSHSKNSPESSRTSLQSLSKFFTPSLNNRYIGKNRCTPTRLETSDLDAPDKDVKEGTPRFIAAWRRAIIDDKPAIKKLQTLTGNIANALFRKKKLEELIEQSYFPIVQLNSNGELVSFTAYNPYPNISSVSLFWTEWLRTHYRIKDVSARNALFIHYMVWEPQRESEFLPLLLETSFTEFIHLKHIIIVKPPKAQIPNFYEQYFIPVLPLGLEQYEYDSVQSLLVCLRTTVIQPFPIRTAFEEELDSITGVLSNLNVKTLKEQSDSVSELKDSQKVLKQENRKILVCETNDGLIGVMVLNFKIDLDVLNKEYELAPFNGLRKGYSREHCNEQIAPATLQRSSSSKNKEHPGIFKSSDFLFNQMNWDVSIKEISVKDSDPFSSESSSTFSFDSDFLHFSSYSVSNIDTSDSELDWYDTLSQPKNDNSSKSDIKVTCHSSLSRTTHFFSPLHDGESNCFVIDFFAADIHEVDEKLISLDFLKAAFRLFHDKDYCLLTMPSQFLPNRLQEFFVRVPSKLMSTSKLELYLCHKHTLPDTIPIFVKTADVQDLASVNNFLRNVDEGEAVYEDISKTCTNGNSSFKSYLLFAGKQIVGVSMIDCRDYQEIFYAFFDLVTHIPDLNVSENQSLLKHLIINPAYHCHVRFFMRQIMKLSNLTCLYYAYSSANKGSCSLVTVLGEFIPIKPRKKTLYDTSYLITDQHDGCLPPFSLYFLTEKSCNFNKIHLNIVIVVVGASSTALSFLEHLVFGSTKMHVHYNNLICVTPHGLEVHHNGSSGSEITDQMFPIRDDCSKNYILMLSLKTYVSFVHGVMTAINRSEKYITVNNKVIIKYDYLILTCGVQYLTPVPKAKEVSKKICQRHYVGSLARFLKNSKTQKKKVNFFKQPSNMFLINTTWDAKNSLRILQNLIHKTKKTEKKIIVYGHNLHVFLTIHTLMKLGIPGEAIAFVEPLLPDQDGKVTVFNDFSVDQAVLKSLENSKVKYYNRYFLYDWTMNTEDDRITSVTFHSKTSKLVIPCLAFFPFVERLVSEVTYKACSEAGLVYDGRLVIDHNFRTNDKYIYAAGSFTKYARRYFASDQDHQHFNSREVGGKLAQIIRSKVDPFVADVTKKKSDLVPQLKEPIMYYCQLPGDFNFFVLRKPGKELDLETAYNLKDYGEVLYTGDCQMKHGIGYFRLHLSPEGFVESITCYTKDKIDYVNLSYLYGLHEKLLNNLLCRYDLSLIPDFFDYFQQPWAHALFHENFQTLREYNVEALGKKLSDGTNFIDKVVKNLEKNEWKSISYSTAMNTSGSQEFKKKNKYNCVPDQLKRFKPPLVHSSDFPSRVSLINEDFNTAEEFGENENIQSLYKIEQEKSPLTYWRIAHFSDIDNIKNLIENSDFVMNDLFGEPDVMKLIELSNFALVQFNSKQELVSFISLFCYPGIPAVPSFEWYPWLQTNYKLNDVTPRNTFFIHYMIWKTEYYYDFLKLALETVFLENVFCRNILIMKPPKVKLPRIFSEYFIHVLPKDAQIYNCDCNSLQTALVCLRNSVMERLKIRLAMVEDHDDLMPIAEQHNERLRELYGNYCMAEIIQYPGSPNRKTLVCESKGYAVGFMTLNTAIDFDLLNSQFELSLFHGLRKKSKDDQMAEDLDLDEETPVLMPKNIDPLLEVVTSETLLRFLSRRPSLCTPKEYSSESNSSDEFSTSYNELSHEMSELIHETLNLKLVPKFSAHALGSFKSNSTEEKHLNSDSSNEICFSVFGKAELEEEQTSLKSESSLVSLQHFNLPIYHGPPNAFCIEFFAMDKNFDDRLCQDFLEAAFEVFEDLEYCILTLPTYASTFPLLEFFTRVTPRPLKMFRQELYVCHRSSAFISFMRVRRTLKPDLEEIRKLLKGIFNSKLIFADIVNSCYFEDSAFQSFVLICSDSIIGVAVLCNECGMEYLAPHYNVSEFIDFENHSIEYHAILKHLVLSPIFHSHSRFFLRDIMRMADITCLYRCYYEESELARSRFSLITILGHFIPVKPRRMVKYHEPSLGPNIPPSYYLTRDEPFSLYHLNQKLCSSKTVSCNKNIVIVGASKTAYSFLETLLYGTSGIVTYNNITMVAPHGLGTELPSHTARDYMFPFCGKYNRFYNMQLCLKTYVNLVYGVMTKINRVDKYIVINNESILPYDYLILLCGRQFAMPVPLTMVNNSQECKRHYRPRSTLFKYLFQQEKEQTSNSVYPPNAFLINTVVDGTNALISLQYLVQKRKEFPADEKIIIYGHNIHVYLCVQSLLKYGIPPDLIVLVEPFPVGTNSITCFEDENIDKAVLRTLAEIGIEHYKGFFLYDWTLCKDRIQTVTFHSDHRKITIKCLAMFPFEKKVVSDVTFKAINEASLVYDGKLVINNCFQTNDPCIYAAGGLTKYQRKYYAKDKSHRNYSSDEVGRHLGEIVRKEIDPTVRGRKEKVRSEVVPEMTEPLILFGILPGDWHYFRVRKPGKRVHEETRASIKEYGDTLITGDCEMSQGRGYFKLLLDDYGFVSGIFCYSKDAIDVKNLEVLYGKHEKLLNDLLLRFDLGMIKDFYSYFREPWVYAVFHDRFHMLMENNRQLFDKENTHNGEKILDSVINLLEENDWQRPSKEKLNVIKEKFDKSSIKEEIVSNIMDFLTYFDEPFPMYATPRILRMLLYDASVSLLHKLPAFGAKPIIKISKN